MQLNLERIVCPGDRSKCLPSDRQNNGGHLWNPWIHTARPFDYGECREISRRAVEGLCIGLMEGLCIGLMEDEYSLFKINHSFKKKFQ